MDFRLQTVDYVLILGSLILSSAAGVYYGIVKKKNNSAEEYFLASRELSAFAMGCSTFATIISSGYIVGLVAEVYYYGILASVASFWLLLAQYININIFFPVFHKIGSPDLYTYYELRFFKQIRYFLSFTTIIEKMFSNSVIIYGTVVVLSNVSGVSMWTLAVTTTIVCALYSSLGGVRGVSIADTIQAFVMTGAIGGVFVLGVQHAGGIGVVLQRSWDTGRLNVFNFDFNPKTRHTFWTTTIGALIGTVGMLGTSQISVMRMMASSSIKKCQKAGYLGIYASVAVLNVCSFISLLVYATYYTCDPMASKKITSANQLISMYIGHELSAYTGLAGVFLAGLACAAVSTISSTLNAISALVMETFVKSFNLVKSEAGYTTTAKLVVLVHAGLSLSGIAVVERFPNVYQAAIVVMSVLNAPHLTLLLIGMFFPKVNLKSAVASFTIGIVFMLWIMIGALFVKEPSKPLPISIAGCHLQNVSNISNTTFEYINSTIATTTFNATLSPSSITTQPNIWNRFFPLSSTSYIWFSAVGTIFTFLVFVVLTALFGAENNREVNLDLIPEPVQKFQKRLSKKWQKLLLCDVYTSDTEMTIIENEMLLEKDTVHAVNNIT